MAKQEAGVIPQLGLHPWYLGKAKAGWENRLHDLLSTCTAGIGECGLDFAIQDANQDGQVAALEAQWRMAVDMNRPLSLHCRKAFDALFHLAEKAGLPKRGAAIHAFSGGAEQAKIAIRHGFYLSFACSLMNPKNKRARSAIMAVPLERLLLETDSPDISPVYGELNEPANLLQLHSAAADLLDVKLETLAEQLRRNAEKIFIGLRK